jgi:hypothetical protein
VLATSEDRRRVAIWLGVGALSLALNLGFIAVLSMLRGQAQPPAAERAIEVALVPADVINRLPDLPPELIPAARSPRKTVETTQRTDGGGVAQPESPTPPSGSASEEGEIDPSDYAITTGVTPAGLRPYVGVDPCRNPDIRLRPERCRSEWREATNAIDERDARADRALRVRTMERELGVRHCGGKTLSYQLGILDPGSRGVGCGVEGEMRMPGDGPEVRVLPGMRPGGPASVGGPVSAPPNAYHTDPAFGCPDWMRRRLRSMPELDLVGGIVAPPRDLTSST